MKRAIMMDKKDNVATALTAIEPGDEVEVISVKREAVKQLTARSPLPLGHKIDHGWRNTRSFQLRRLEARPQVRSAPWVVKG